MIQITVGLLNKEQEIKEIEVTGHADYGEYGHDIVCAAVSSQVISVENSIVQLLSVPVETIVNEVEGGYLKMILPQIDQKTIHHDVQLLMRHLVYALEVTQDAYPEYIEIKTINL